MKKTKANAHCVRRLSIEIEQRATNNVGLGRGVHKRVRFYFFRKDQIQRMKKNKRYYTVVVCVDPNKIFDTPSS